MKDKTKFLSKLSLAKNLSSALIWLNKNSAWTNLTSRSQRKQSKIHA
jgi:hypothetical protein